MFIKYVSIIQINMQMQRQGSILSLYATMQQFIIFQKYILREQNFKMITSYDRVTQIMSIEGQKDILKEIRSLFLQEMSKYIVYKLEIEFWGSSVLLNTVILTMLPKAITRAIKLSDLQTKMKQNKNIRLQASYDENKNSKITWIVGPKEQFLKIKQQIIDYIQGYNKQKKDKSKMKQNPYYKVPNNEIKISSFQYPSQNKEAMVQQQIKPPSRIISSITKVPLKQQNKEQQMKKQQQQEDDKIDFNYHLQKYYYGGQQSDKFYYLQVLSLFRQSAFVSQFKLTKVKITKQVLQISGKIVTKINKNVLKANLGELFMDIVKKIRFVKCFKTQQPLSDRQILQKIINHKKYKFFFTEDRKLVFTIMTKQQLTKQKNSIKQFLEAFKHLNILSPKILKEQQDIQQIRQQKIMINLGLTSSFCSVFNYLKNVLIRQFQKLVISNCFTICSFVIIGNILQISGKLKFNAKQKPEDRVKQISSSFNRIYTNLSKIVSKNPFGNNPTRSTNFQAYASQQLDIFLSDNYDSILIISDKVDCEKLPKIFKVIIATYCKQQNISVLSHNSKHNSQSDSQLGFGDFYRQYINYQKIKNPYVNESIMRSSIRHQVRPKIHNKKQQEIQKQLSYPLIIGSTFSAVLANLKYSHKQIRIEIRPFNFQGGYIPSIYDQQVFTVIGQKTIVDQVCRQLQATISNLSNQKKIMSYNVGETIFEKIKKQKTLRDNISNVFKAKIVLNPQVQVGYEIQYLRLLLTDFSYKILGIHGSNLQFFIDRMRSIAIFGSKQDRRQYLKLFPLLNTIIDKNFCTHSYVLQDQQQKLFEAGKKQIAKFLENSSSKTIRVFILAEASQLREFVWSVMKNIGDFKSYKCNIRFIIVYCNEQIEQESESFSRSQKKWYAEVNGYKKFYKEEGNFLINEAIQNKKKIVLFNSEHVDIQKPTHQWYRGQKMLYPIRYGQKTQYRQNGNTITYKIKKREVEMPEKCVELIRQAESHKTNKLYLFLPNFEINLQRMCQTHMWNGYQRDISYIEESMESHRFIMQTGKIQSTINIVGDTNDALKLTAEQLITVLAENIHDQIIFERNVKAEKMNEIIKVMMSYQIQFANSKGNSIQIKFEKHNRGVNYVKSLAQKQNNGGLICFPQFWSSQKKPIDTHFKSFEIKPTDAQFKQIKNNFSYKITKLIRLENYILYARYQQESRFLSILNDGKPMKQKYLYHGSRSYQPSKIYQDCEISFNINFSSANNMMGRATYFAQNPKYSHAYRYQIDTIKKIGCMLLCQVMVGESQKCPKTGIDYRDTQFKPGRKVRYESMTAFYDGSQIYTVYKNNRAYPLYRIEYEY